MAEARPEVAAKLAEALNVSPILAQMLLNRGYENESSARWFLNAQLRDLRDPFEIPGMIGAVERTVKALEQNESITLYGDYDVDGVTSVAILNRVLSTLLGSQPSLLRTFLPDRLDEGYGLTSAGIDRCLATGCPALLIALDCGTNSKTEVCALREKGVDVLILDHHEPSDPAEPLALVNYKLGKEEGMWGAEYCTAGLVFKFCHALLKTLRSRDGRMKATAMKIDLKEYLDLVALATVADIAPLTGENRILVRHGLRQMASTRWMGLKTLMRLAAVKNEPTGYDCGFRLGPRLNAAGRLESAMASLNLLLSEKEEVAEDLARQLDEINRQRQQEEARVLAEAREDAITQISGIRNPESGIQDQPLVLVLARPGWHEGVVGIVASRLAREFYLPTFVIALDGEGDGRGSGRSVEGFNLAAAIEVTRSFLIRGGGHAMAAGISLKAGQIEPWREALQEHAFERLGGRRLRRTVRLDAEVRLSGLNLSLAEELKNLEPCGVGSPRPLLIARKVEVAADPRRVGSEAQHLKLWLRQDGAAVDAIAFGRGNLPVGKGHQLDVVFELECNEYQGQKKIQMNIREIAQAE